MNKFNERFAEDETHNSCCLTTVGCFARHDLSREEQRMSYHENRARNFETPNKTEYEEDQLMNMVVFLQQQGCQLKQEETLEKYVTRNSDKLLNADYETLERMVR